MNIKIDVTTHHGLVAYTAENVVFCTLYRMSANILNVFHNIDADRIVIIKYGILIFRMLLVDVKQLLERP